jgi:hypothetical protein
MILAVIFLMILPVRGITDLRQIDTLEYFRRVEGVLLLANWLHFLFSLTIGIVSLYLFTRIRQRGSLLRFLVGTVLTVICIFLIGHDLGPGLLGWPRIAADPSWTAFSQDLMLLNARNVILFGLGLLTALDAYRQQINVPSMSTT